MVNATVPGLYAWVCGEGEDNCPPVPPPETVASMVISSTAVVIVTLDGPALKATANAPLLNGVVWSTPSALTDPMVTMAAVVQDTTMVCAPDNVPVARPNSMARLLVALPESVPLIRVALVPPTVTVM